MIGKTLLHYEILEPLGAGGMGEVYRARDTSLHRDVAIKVLPAELSADPDRLARLEREAHLLAALNHSNIATIHALEKDKGTRFLVLELVKGESLEQRLSRGPLPVEKALEVCKQIAEALEAAHGEGIVHRDLKPANVLITPDGQVKVLDFGIAKSMAVDVAETSNATNLTVAGTLVGTPAYMSPEQVRDEPLDKRADIWAFGCLLYESLTARSAFGGETLADTLAAIIDQDPDWEALSAAGADHLQPLIRRCLQKYPKRRLRDIGDAWIEIEEALDAGGKVATASVSPPSPASRWWPPAMVIAVVAGFAALWMAGIFSMPATGPAGPPIPTFTNARQITSVIGVEDVPTWSPDGLTLAYGSFLLPMPASLGADIWVQQIDGGPPIKRTPEELGTALFPSWSPDGRNIAFVSDRDGRAVYVMSALGGEARKVMNTNLDSVLESPPQWLSDGAELAAISEDGATLEIVELETRQARQLTLSVAAGNTADWRWSPDGRLVAYAVAVSRTAQISRIWVMRLEDGESFPVTEEGNNWNPMWSRDGTSLYYISNRGGAMDLWVQGVDDQGTVGSASAVTVGIGMRSASFSRDFSKLAFSRGRSVANVWRVPILPDRRATWADAEPITAEDAYIEYLDISPDGTTLVFNSDRTGNLDLWAVPLDGGEWRALTTHAMPDWAPRYSADGRNIVFHSHNDGSRDLFIVPNEGGVIRPLIESPEFEFMATFSPDGQHVAYYNRSADNDLWVVSTEDGSRAPLIQKAGAQFMPEWSPDGGHILYTERRGAERNTVWKATGSGETPEQLAESTGWAARWSPDGSTIYFIRDDNLWAVSATGGDERRLTDLVGKRGLVDLRALATDGRYLYFTWRLDTGDIWVMDVVTED